MVIYKVGPCGGLGGGPFSLISRNDQSIKLLKIKIHHGQIIYGIQVLYQDGEDHPDWSPLWGSSNGAPKTDEISLLSGEYLKSVNGHHEKLQDMHLIMSLEFVTNRHKYGPYGDEKGHSFSLPATNGKIVGFHGRSGLYVDSFGILVETDGTDDAGSAKATASKKDSVHQKEQSNQVSGGINITINNTNKGNTKDDDGNEKRSKCGCLADLISICAKIVACAF